MDDHDLPKDVRAALERGRLAYVDGKYPEAEVADREALTCAMALGSAAGAVRARRLLGLCAYRRGDSKGSEDLLRGALAGATAMGWEAEALLVLNHLGATLRKLGRLDEADQTFRDALERAQPRHHLVARTRLLASYGAFLDDLGDTRAAAEHYARHEELLSLLDDPGRLANARGLVSRAARMRGDHATALAKAKDEIRLGAQARHPLREGGGWMHLAQAHAAMGAAEQAEEAFVQADGLLTGSGDARSPIRVACARGQFYLQIGKIHEAFAQVSRATKVLSNLPATEHEHRTTVSELAAGVSAAAGLHGEALWHLANALESQLARFQPIADPRLQPFTEARRQGLANLAERLLKETAAVDRSADESSRVESLLKRLSVDRPAVSPSTETVEVWRRRVRHESEQRWTSLLGGAFAVQAEQTCRELVLADLVSAGPVGDLSRSLLLLFGTIERELRERVIDPVKKMVTTRARKPKGGSKLHRLIVQGRPMGLGDMVDALLEPAKGWDVDDARCQVERRLGGSSPLDGLRPLREEVPGVDGKMLRMPTDWRNDVAHGRAWTASRTDGDAVRRALTIGATAPLRVVVGLPTLGLNGSSAPLR